MGRIGLNLTGQARLDHVLNGVNRLKELNGRANGSKGSGPNPALLKGLPIGS